MKKSRRHPKIIPLPPKSGVGRVLYDKPHNRKLHEKELAVRLTRFGWNVLFTKESKLKGARSSDCIWLDDEHWEMKTIFGSSPETIHRALKAASKQSNNIVIDVAYSRRSIERVVCDVLNYYHKRSRGTKNKRVLIIDRDRYCLLDKTMLL